MRTIAETQNDLHGAFEHTIATVPVTPILTNEPDHLGFLNAGEKVELLKRFDRALAAVIRKVGGDDAGNRGAFTRNQEDELFFCMVREIWKLLADVPQFNGLHHSYWSGKAIEGMRRVLVQGSGGVMKQAA